MTKATKTTADPELYAPNQQLVRPDGSGPAEEGDGGSTGPPPEPEPDPEPETAKTSKTSSTKTDS